MSLVFSFTWLLLNDFISNRKIVHKLSIKNRPSSHFNGKLNLKTEFFVEYFVFFLMIIDYMQNLNFETELAYKYANAISYAKY